ncbi:MAG: NAD-dependent epimerase/dehydratase family protein [Steroidobacteraceae bacterium]
MRALVTGATGYIGSELVRALLRRGDDVRILARSATRAAPLVAAGAQLIVGDLAEPRSVKGSCSGRDVVFHLASAIRGSEAEFARVDIEGTCALVSEAKRAGVRRLVYPGTLSSYDMVHVRDGALLDEASPFDGTGRLGHYARAKARAEAIVLEAHRRGKLEGVIVRLGLTCGTAADIFPPHIGRLVRPNLLVLFGDGRVALPLVLLENAVEALILAATTPGIGGEAFNIVDAESLTQRDYITLYRRVTGSALRVVRAPRLAYYALGAATALAARLKGKDPLITPYRVRARLRTVRWNCSKAEQRLLWRSRVPLRAGLTTAFEARQLRAGL